MERRNPEDEVTSSNIVVRALEDCNFGINGHWSQFLINLGLDQDTMVGLQRDAIFHGTNSALNSGVDRVLQMKKVKWREVVDSAKRCQPILEEKLTQWLKSGVVDTTIRPEQSPTTTTTTTTCRNDKENNNFYSVLVEVLYSFSPEMNDLLKGDKLQNVANRLFPAIISVSVRDEPVYNKIEGDFAACLKYLKEECDFRERCEIFLSALQKEGGPLSIVAKSLASKWKKEVRDKLGIDFDIEF